MSCTMHLLTVTSKFVRNVLALQRILAGCLCKQDHPPNASILWTCSLLEHTFLPNVYQNSQDHSAMYFVHVQMIVTSRCSQKPKHTILLLLSTVSTSAFCVFHRCHKMSCGAALVWQGWKETNFLIHVHVYVPGTCFYNTWSSF